MLASPLDRLLRTPTRAADPALLHPLARAAAATARLDQAAAAHPLLPALTYRTRLDAVRHQAAADGHVIDPWHLAALIEGLRPRLDGAARIADAGGIFDAGRTALAYHRWLVTPDPDEDAAIDDALAELHAATATGVPLLDAAAASWRWLDRGGARLPLRAALVRYWVSTGTLRAPLPLTGAVALRADTDWDPDSWTAAFLTAMADEAAAALNTLVELERAWFAARRAVAGRRRHSRAPAAVDLLAAAPLISATTLATALGLSIKSAIVLLDDLARLGVVVEVTGRAARRLFGLRGLAPLAAVAAPPRRPAPGRGRGRPRVLEVPASTVALGPLERQAFDYADLDAAVAALDETIRRARLTFGGAAGGRRLTIDSDQR